ncbi:MAG: osmoprotectant NAGGN system M42 family peptidase [Puniceicoccales bacterium]
MDPTSNIDTDYLKDILLHLLRIHSPTGYTDPIVREVCSELDDLGIDYELTRRGAIRSTLPGKKKSPDRAIIAHLDTLGAMVAGLKENGRLRIVPVGTWSSRFAEGARVSIFTDNTILRGTILPLKASGHIFNDEVDTQPCSWDNLEIRVDEKIESIEDLRKMGINVGDFVGVDSVAECMPNGYISARHLDDKAGVASLLAAVRYLKQNNIELPVDLHILFTISEEVGSGASAVLHGDVAEMVSIDNGTCGPGQNSSEFGVTVAVADSSGPFDYHLTHHLLHLCQNGKIPHQRDIFRYYRCDSASALDAGNDIRTALITFGVDASHGYERTNLQALESIARLVVSYARSEMIFERQKDSLGGIQAFPETRRVDVKSVVQENSERIVQETPDAVIPDEEADGSEKQ